MTYGVEGTEQLGAGSPGCASPRRLRAGTSPGGADWSPPCIVWASSQHGSCRAINHVLGWPAISETLTPNKVDAVRLLASSPIRHHTPREGAAETPGNAQRPSVNGEGQTRH